MKDGPLGKVERRLERLKRRTYTTASPRILGQDYYYVFGFTKMGKKVFWGPTIDAHEADSWLAELEDGEIFPLKTRDVPRATREVKAILMARGEDPDEVLKRVLHKRE